MTVINNLITIWTMDKDWSSGAGLVWLVGYGVSLALLWGAFALQELRKV